MITSNLFIPASCSACDLAPGELKFVGHVTQSDDCDELGFDVCYDVSSEEVHVFLYQAEKGLLYHVLQEAKKKFEEQGENRLAMEMDRCLFYLLEPLAHKRIPDWLLKKVREKLPNGKFGELSKNDVVYLSSVSA